MRLAKSHIPRYHRKVGAIDPLLEIRYDKRKKNEVSWGRGVTHTY